MELYGCFLKWWYPQNTSKWSFLVGKTMVVGYQHFRIPPYNPLLISLVTLGPTLGTTGEKRHAMAPPWRRKNGQSASESRGARREKFGRSPNFWSSEKKTATGGFLQQNEAKMEMFFLFFLMTPDASCHVVWDNIINHVTTFWQIGQVFVCFNFITYRIHVWYIYLYIHLP